MTNSTECAAALLEAIPAAMRVVRRHMRSHRLPGMSVPQFRALAYLDRYGPATLSDAAEQIGTTLPSMSRLMQALVEAGLVGRRAGAPDRRTVALEITARGRRVLARARTATVEQLAAQLDDLAPADVRRLTDAMRLLQRAMSGESHPGSLR